jgi:hypothetical protein
MSATFSTTAKPAPWEHRRWRNGICRSGLLGPAIAFWVAVAVCAGIVTLIAIKSPRMLHFSQSRWEVLFPLCCALFGGGFLIGALIATARWIRFGRCRVQMRTVPGVIGGHFRGEVLLPESFPSDTDVRMELICESTTTITRKGDKSDHLSIDRLWTRTHRVTANASLSHDGACALPFDFSIPYGLSDATDSKVEGDVRVDIDWTLRVFAKLKGPDLNMRFHVPVFRTAESDPSVKGEPENEKPLETFLNDTGQKRRVRMEFENGATTYICDALGLQAGVSFVPIIFGFVFLAAGLFAGFNGLPEIFKEVLKPAQGWANLFRLIPLVMSVGLCLITGVFSLFGLLFLCIGVNGLVARRTWIENGVINQRLSFLGIPWRRSCPCSSATGVNIGDTTKSGGQTWYGIVIERDTEAQYKRLQWRYLFSRMTVATNVPTQCEAQDIMDQLQKELRL